MLRLNPSIDAINRYEEDTGVIRSLFRTGPVDEPIGESLSCASTSDEFLSVNSELFDLEGIGLELSEEKEGNAQVTCKYEQYYKNIPVYGAYLNVTLRKSDRQVMSAVNRIDYTIREDFAEPIVRLSSGDALKRMYDRYNPEMQGITHNEPVLYIYRKQLVWRIEMDSLEPKRYFELMISAVDGDFVGVFDRRRFYTSRPAKVFWPDPVTSSRNPDLHWGSPEVLLDSELVDVTLDNLDDSAGLLRFLSGKWVRITELEKPEVILPAAETEFIYSSKDRRFLSVMAYYYLDRLVEWIRLLEIPAFNDALTDPIDVDAQGVAGEDNSHFVSPVSGPVYLAFGEGGTPDASDPGVITHEFGHALHYYLLGKLIPPGSCEEGFNDFFSCVFRDRFNGHGFDRANPFPWDNNPTVSWDPSRRCDTELRFDDPSFDTYGFYRKGTIYATALWDIYLETGGKSENSVDRLKAADEIAGIYLDMLIAVGDTGPVMDLVNGLISSDKSRTGGRCETVIRDAFSRRGLPV